MIMMLKSTLNQPQNCPTFGVHLLSKATINRELACLKKMLTYAVGEKWLNANPLKGYKLFQERPNKVRVVSNKEFQSVYDSASEFLKPILVTAYNTGMRRSEILKLRWDNVNLSEDYITIEDSKNGESRHIPVNKHLKETLKSVKSYSAGDYVFSRNGKPPKCFKTAFDRAVIRSGGGEIYFSRP
jgi:integrase